MRVAARKAVVLRRLMRTWSVDLLATKEHPDGRHEALRLNYFEIVFALRRSWAASGSWPRPLRKLVVQDDGGVRIKLRLVLRTALASVPIPA